MTCKKYLYLLILLNILDIVSTVIGVKTGLFIEINPLVVKVLTLETACAIKIFAFLLLAYLAFNKETAYIFEYRIIKYLLITSCIIYSVIAVYHLFLWSLLFHRWLIFDF